MVNVHVVVVEVGDCLEDDDGFLAAPRRNEEARRLVQPEQNTAGERTRKVLWST